MKKVLLLLFAMGTATMITHCSYLTGGGTESTNGYVVGMVVEDDGSPAEQTKVMLVASTYDPVKNGPVPDSMTDTTDESGVFSLRAAGGRTFNIEAYQQSSGNRMLLTGIRVNQNDTNYIPVHAIQKPGAIKFIPPAMDNLVNGYVYIPGTTRFAETRQGNALIDSVPAGFISSIRYADVVDSTKGRVVASDFTVSVGNTAVIADSSVWKYSKKFLLNTTASGANVAVTLTNFPVLIRLTSGIIDFSQARADGGDLRFIKEAGMPLPYEIERWDPVAGLAEVWVKVDTVYGNDIAHSFVMYWGNADAAPQSDPAAVFDTAAGFAGVWHLDQPVGAMVPDATANGINGTATATATVSGAIGAAQSFDGTSSLIQASGPESNKVNFPDTGTFSVSAWVKASVLDSLCQAIVFKSNAQYGMQIIPEHEWEFVTYIDKTRWEGTRSPATAGSWHAIAAVRNGTKQYLYVDGICADSSMTNIIAIAPENVSRAYDKPLEIGHCPDGGRNPDRFFNGIIDEVRISKTALTADWMKLCYKNQKEQDALVKW